METTKLNNSSFSQKRAKRKTRKAGMRLWGPVMIFAGLITLFMYLVSSQSDLQIANEELMSQPTVETTKVCFEKYKATLEPKDFANFTNSVRTHLASLPLSKEDINQVRDWLPPAQKSLNIVVVPDLSMRTPDPQLEKRDKELLAHIYKAFSLKVGKKIGSKDRIQVALADPNQAGQNFRQIADSLDFNLANHPNKNQASFFYLNKNADRYKRNIDALYELAESQRPLACDYRQFFCRDLKSITPTNSIDTEYRNVIILLTDGYAENMKSNESFSGTQSDRNKIYQLSLHTNSLEEAFQLANVKPIPNCAEAFPEWEVLILEVDENKNGIDQDFEILKKFWTDWLLAMKVKNAKDDFFHKKRDQLNYSKEQVDKLFSRNL